MSTKYLQVEIEGEEAFVRADSVNRLREADAVVFDCDGVLIDIRESYNRAISETITHIIKGLTGFQPPENLVSREVIYLFKKSGGFNNDWDVAYAMLMGILCGLPRGFQEVFENHVIMNRREKDLLRRFLSVKDGIRKEYNLNDLDDIADELGEGLRQLAKTCDVFGILSIDRNLGNSPRALKGFYSAAKHFLSYPGEVGESLLITVFEEIFCGHQLFRNLYEREPIFYQGSGLVENERLIIQPEALDQLTSVLGRANFGVASGRPYKLAKYKLNRVLERLNPEALVFLEDVEEAERESSKTRGATVNLMKPKPFSLLRSSEGLKPVTLVLYVGDSMEDAIMVEEANEVDPRFSFVGVYSHSDCKNEVLRSFLDAGAEVVLPSVNELPTVLTFIKEEAL